MGLESTATATIANDNSKPNRPSTRAPGLGGSAGAAIPNWVALAELLSGPVFD